MKIKLRELRRYVAKVISEAYDSPTIPAQADPHEQELAKKYPKWCKNRNEEEGLKNPSPTSIKAKRVIATV